MPKIRPWFDAPRSEEIEVLQLLARGYRYTEIAKRLYITPGGAKDRVNMLRRLHKFRTNLQLAMYAVQAGWVTVRHPHETRSRQG